MAKIVTIKSTYARNLCTSGQRNSNISIIHYFNIVIICDLLTILATVASKICFNEV